MGVSREQISERVQAKDQKAKYETARNETARNETARNEDMTAMGKPNTYSKLCISWALLFLFLSPLSCNNSPQSDSSEEYSSDSEYEDGYDDDYEEDEERAPNRRRGSKILSNYVKTPLDKSKRTRDKAEARNQRLEAAADF